MYKQFSGTPCRVQGFSDNLSMLLLTCFVSDLTDSDGGSASQALYTCCVLLQVRAYLHIDDTMYSILTSAEDLTPLVLSDHWQELPHLNKLGEHFEELTEQLSVSMPRKQLELTQADLVQHAPYNVCCWSCPGSGNQHTQSNAT